jgi:arylsulfatase A-like enzyme
MKNPNILFLFPDQWRHDFLGNHESGVPVRTPHLDSLAKRGTRFTQCRTNAPLCAPARACLALGVRRRHCGVIANGQDTDPSRSTIFNRLQESGYWTATCGKNDLHKGSNDFHASGWSNRLADYGFDAAIDQRGKANVFKAYNREPRGEGPYMQYLEERGLLETYVDDYRHRRDLHTESYLAAWPTPLERCHYIDDFCGRSALELLDRTPDDQPWFLWVNFPGPHGPMDAPADLFERYREVDLPPVFNGGDGIDHESLRRLYAAACEGLDEWCGRIIEAAGKRDNGRGTIIIFASDHGEMLGDHGLWGKRYWRESSVRVPLIVAGPGIAEGTVTGALAELIDIGATVLDYAGAESTPGQEARSLRPVLEESIQEHRDFQISDLGDWRLATNGRFKIVRDSTGEHVFDLLVDPEETLDLAPCQPEVDPVIPRLREHLEESFA